LKDKKSFFANLGFSLNEVKAILFLSFLFILGFAIYFLSDTNQPKAFDYKNSDSAFYSNNTPKSDKKTKANLKIKQPKKLLGNKKINLLTADIEELQLLDGITLKKAQEIIKLRKNGKLINCIDLVKEGIISRSLFENIKTSIYIN
jgi:hypothetical protein